MDAAVQSLSKMKSTLREVHIFVSSTEDFDKICSCCYRQEQPAVDQFIDTVSAPSPLVKNDFTSRSRTQASAGTTIMNKVHLFVHLLCVCLFVYIFIYLFIHM